MASEPLQLSPAQIKAAANARRLVDLAEQLVRERRWDSIQDLLSNASLEDASLDELVSALQALDRGLGHLPPSKLRSAKVVSQLETLRAMAGDCLAGRLHHVPITKKEQTAMVLAAELLLAGGKSKESAALFERAGEDGRAADAHGLSGDIENMERCHERLEQRRGAKRASNQLTRKVESLIEAGERMAALKLMQDASKALLESAGLSNCKKTIAERLCRSRALTLRINSNHGELLRVTGLPATMGRQTDSEIPLRDPSVSRQHAMIVADEGQLAIEDANSRSGTKVGNARLVGKIPVLAEMELCLGQSCRLLLELLSDAPSAKVLRVAGQTGFDRSLLAFVVQDHFDLHWAIPTVSGVRIQVGKGILRLERLASQPVRVASHYVGLECDLMIGDLIEIPIAGIMTPIVLEVLA